MGSIGNFNRETPWQRTLTCLVLITDTTHTSLVSHGIALALPAPFVEIVPCPCYP